MNERKKKRTTIGSVLVVLILLTGAGLWEAEQSQEIYEQAQSQSPGDDQSPWLVETFTNADDGWIEQYRLKRERAEAWVRIRYGITDNNKIKIAIDTYRRGVGESHCYVEDGIVKTYDNVIETFAALYVIMKLGLVDYLPIDTQLDLLEITVAVGGLLKETELDSIPYNFEKETTPIDSV